MSLISIVMATAIASACAPAMESTVALTAAKAKDKLIVEALGPDCKDPVFFARLFRQDGRMIFARAIGGAFALSTESFPCCDGTVKGTIGSVFEVMEEMSAAELPVWKKGAKAPGKGNYSVFEVAVPYEFYARIKKEKRPLLIERGGYESGRLYVYSSESGELVLVAEYSAG